MFFFCHCSQMEHVGGWQSQERWMSTRNQRGDFPTRVPSTQPLTQRAKEHPVITATTVVLNLDTVPRSTPTSLFVFVASISLCDLCFPARRNSQGLFWTCKGLRTCCQGTANSRLTLACSLLLRVLFGYVLLKIKLVFKTCNSFDFLESFCFHVLCSWRINKCDIISLLLISRQLYQTWAGKPPGQETKRVCALWCGINQGIFLEYVSGKGKKKGGQMKEYYFISSYIILIIINQEFGSEILLSYWFIYLKVYVLFLF